MEDIKSGEILTIKNLRAILPGLGLPCKFYDVLLGKKVKKDCKKGTAINWEIFK